MKVGKGLFLLGLGTAAGAAYFFNGRKGRERRRSIKKQLEQAAHITNRVVDDCSKRAKTITSSLMKNGASEWYPSPRFAGALGSVLTVYSVGRRGPAGTILRLLSLGLFARSLMGPNDATSNIKERTETQKVNPASTMHQESPVVRKEAIGVA
jgi:hypothetical protein